MPYDPNSSFGGLLKGTLVGDGIELFDVMNIVEGMFEVDVIFILDDGSRLADGAISEWLGYGVYLRM